MQMCIRDSHIQALEEMADIQIHQGGKYGCRTVSVQAVIVFGYFVSRFLRINSTYDCSFLSLSPYPYAMLSPSAISMLEEEKDEEMREMIKETLNDSKKRVEELEHGEDLLRVYPRRRNNPT